MSFYHPAQVEVFEQDTYLNMNHTLGIRVACF